MPQNEYANIMNIKISKNLQLFMNIESVNKYNASFYHFKYYKKTYSVPKLRTHTHPFNGCCFGTTQV